MSCLEHGVKRTYHRIIYSQNTLIAYCDEVKMFAAYFNNVLLLET